MLTDNYKQLQSTRMDKTAKERLGKPRQIRFPAEVEKDLQAIADANGLEWVDAVRLVARFGLPILKKKLGSTLKEAA